MRRFLPVIAGIACIVVAWWVIAFFLDASIILPGPGETFRRLWTELSSGAFYRHLAVTAFRAVTGFLLSLAAGLVWGVAAGLSPRARSVLTPALVLIRSTPVIAVILLAIIWFSPNAAPVIVTWLMVMPIVEQSVEHGVRSGSSALIEMATLFRVPRRRIIRDIHVPALRPFVRGASHSGLGMAYKVTVAAEVLVQPPWSIGGAMQEARFYLDTPRLIGLTIVVILLGGATEVILRAIDRLADRRGGVPARRPRPLPEGPPGELPAASMARPAATGQHAGSTAQQAATGQHAATGGSVTFRTESITKAFGALPVLDSVSLEVRSGKVTTLLGPSGCGKTTLLRIMAGLEMPDSGRVDVHASRLSMVFQEPRLLDWRDARANVRFVLPESEQPRAFDWLDAVGIAEASGQYPPQLSGGMRQRLALARAFAVAADGILMDEPFQNVDLAVKLALCRTTRELHAQRAGATLFVTHDVVEAALVSDEVVVLSGRPMRVIERRENPLGDDDRDPRTPALQEFVSGLYALLLSSSQQ
jgi:NitT/TauT family transport system permease protein